MYAPPRFRTAQLVLALAGLLAGCEAQPEEVEFLTDGDPAPLRAVMMQIDQVNWKIEPVVRLESEFGAVASWARSIESLSKDPAWEEFMSRDSFLGNRPKFEGYRGWLLAGASTLAAGAEAGDVDKMREGFIRLQQSCIACHKRYQPNK